jgi:hypothetical protein
VPDVALPRNGGAAVAVARDRVDRVQQLSRRSARAVERYVEAVVELHALERAAEDEGDTPARRDALAAARTAVHATESQLTGSQLGAARRALAERG